MPSQLDNLVAIGKLKAESPAQEELDGLMHSGRVRIKDAENEALSLESRFDLAYNAAHAFSLAALRVSRLSIGQPVPCFPDAPTNRVALCQ